MDRLYTSKSDVYRRQILTYKDVPRAERVGHHLDSDTQKYRQLALDFFTKEENGAGHLT